MSPLPPEPYPRRLGLTGSIGAGKSTVARLLREQGLSVLDADAVARELSLTRPVLDEVAQRLGPQYLLFEGRAPQALNRPALAALVFADAAKREVLNSILHPRVRARMAELEAQAAGRGEAWIVQDVPLLFEGGAWQQMDAVLLVDAPLEIRVQRVMARDSTDHAAVLARDRAQMPLEQKLALLQQTAGVLIDNSGDEARLRADLASALRQLGVLPDQP